MAWFGRPGASENYLVVEQIPVPVGENCRDCAIKIREPDSGIRIPLSRGGYLYYHQRCWTGTGSD